MSDELALRQLSGTIAAAIGRRDADALAAVLAPGFVHHGEAGVTSDAAAFLQGIRGIPGEILFVTVEELTVDVAGDSAMVTGTQHARLRIDAALVDDRRPFADFFVRTGGAWKLRAAADFSTA